MRASEFQNRVDGVGWPGSVDLDPRRRKGWIRHGGEQRHVVPVLGRSDAVERLVRRVMVGDKQHLGEPELHAGFLRRHQVPVMDGSKVPPITPMRATLTSYSWKGGELKS